MKKEGFLRKEQMSSEQRELAMLLKNKRIEQGRKLEDIASGICSTSYLSRIENNQVKLQDPYLRMLFEKLDINYDEVGVYTKGYRILNKIPRMPSSIVENLVKSFKSFQHILDADIPKLDEVEGIGEIRARTIKQSLKRMQEQFVFDNLML